MEYGKTGHGPARARRAYTVAELRDALALAPSPLRVVVRIPSGDRDSVVVYFEGARLVLDARGELSVAP